MSRRSRDIKEVILARNAADAIVEATTSGYEARYKREKLGLLLGRKIGSRVEVARAVLYRGGRRTRTAIEVDAGRIARRIRELEKRHKSRYMGAFHTHNEVAGSISSALSREDRIPLCDDPAPQVELVASVWVSDAPLRQSQYYLQIRDGRYRIRIVGRQWGRGFPLLPTRVARL